MRQSNHPGDCPEGGSSYRDPRGTGRYQDLLLFGAVLGRDDRSADPNAREPAAPAWPRS
jgi:hypothetical protein